MLCCSQRTLHVLDRAGSLHVASLACVFTACSVCHQRCLGCGGMHGTAPATHQPLPNGGSVTSLDGSFSLADWKANDVLWASATEMDESTMKAPSGGKVITFCREPCATSMTCRARRRPFYNLFVQPCLMHAALRLLTVVMSHWRAGSCITYTLVC